MKNKAPVDCPYEGEREVRSLYLAGKLPDGEAEAFEEHFFACERCAEAVDVGSNLRAALGRAPVASATTPKSAPRSWLPLAAAAAVALGALGLWQLTHRPDARNPAVLRGGTTGPIPVRIEKRPSGNLSVTWTSLPEAARYVVRVLKTDGTSVWSTESHEPRATIDASVISSPETPLDIEVEAMDTMERVIATSELVRVPSGSER